MKRPITLYCYQIFPCSVYLFVITVSSSSVTRSCFLILLHLCCFFCDYFCRDFFFHLFQLAHLRHSVFIIFCFILFFPEISFQFLLPSFSLPFFVFFSLLSLMRCSFLPFLFCFSFFRFSSGLQVLLTSLWIGSMFRTCSPQTRFEYYHFIFIQRGLSVMVLHHPRLIFSPSFPHIA